jgi:hypothetical protein
MSNERMPDELASTRPRAKSGEEVSEPINAKGQVSADCLSSIYLYACCDHLCMS